MNVLIIYKEHDIRDSETFLDFLRNCSKQQNTVLFLDDFDSLLPYPKLSYSFCSTLLMTQHRKHIFGLQAVVAIGSGNIIKISGNRPPFTMGSHWEVPPFTREDVEHLFAQFTEEYKIKFQKDIIDDVFEKTNGHPSMVSFFGAKIHERFCNCKSVSLEQWYEFVQNELFRYIILMYINDECQPHN